MNTSFVKTKLGPKKPGAAFNLMMALSLALMGLASLFVVFSPVTASDFGFVPGNGWVFAMVMAINAASLFTSRTAIDLKFRDTIWTEWVLGFAIVWALFVLTMNAAILWFRPDNLHVSQHQAPAIFYLVLAPSILLLRLVLLLVAEEKYKIATGHPVQMHDPIEPEEPKDPLWQRLLNVLRQIIFLTSKALIAFHLVPLAAILPITVYLLTVVSFDSDSALPIGSLPSMFNRLFLGFASAYLENAATIISRIIVTIFGFFVFIIALTWSVSALLRRIPGFTSRGLNAAEKIWVENAIVSYKDWILSHRKIAFASTTMPILFFAIIPAVIAGLCLLLANFASNTLNAVIAPSYGALITYQPSFWASSCASIIGIFAAMIFGSTFAQNMEGLKKYWRAFDRDLLERQPDYFASNIEPALIGARLKNWFPMNEEFDPEAFHNRLRERYAKAFNSLLRWIAPLILLAIVFDASWCTQWHDDRIRASGPFEISSRDYRYVQALRVEVRCSTYQDDGETKTRLGYSVVFDGDRTFRFGQVNPRNGETLSVIDNALERAGIEKVLVQEDEYDECRERTLDRYGQDGVVIMRILTPR